MRRSRLFHRPKKNLRKIEDRIATEDQFLINQIRILDERIAIVEANSVTGFESEPLVTEQEELRKRLEMYKIEDSKIIERKRTRGKSKKTIEAEQKKIFTVSANNLTYTTPMQYNWDK